MSGRWSGRSGGRISGWTRQALSIACVLAFSAAAQGPAPAQRTFDGFQLGMSRIAALEVWPDSPWRLEAGDDGRDVIRKAFVTRHMDREAVASVDLDARREKVARVTYRFATASRDACNQGAIAALMLLERQYGKEYEAINGPPSMRARWLTRDGLTVRWVEWCDAGEQRYAVSYGLE